MLIYHRISNSQPQTLANDLIAQIAAFDNLTITTRTSYTLPRLV